MLGVKLIALQSTLVSEDTRKRNWSAVATASDKLTGTFAVWPAGTTCWNATVWFCITLSVTSSLSAGWLYVPVTATCPVRGVATVWPKNAEIRKSLPAEYVNSGLRLASERGPSLYVITGPHSTWSKAPSHTDCTRK